MPAVRPSWLADRVWMPPYSRLMAASLAAAVKLSNERVTPGRKSEPVVNAIESLP